MKDYKMRMLLLVLPVLIAAGLSGCGGGEGEDGHHHTERLVRTASRCELDHLAVSRRV